MKIGFIGLGKLGYPVATAMAHRGADITGYDVNPKVMNHKPRPYVETWIDGSDFNDHLTESKLKFGSFQDVCSKKDIIFFAVQTPHQPMYEGITPLPDTRADFDYTYLQNAVKAAQPYIEKDTVLAIISTVLPGTIRREIMPLCKKGRVVYNPSFIAMGTTVQDFLDPEFVLTGGDNGWACGTLAEFIAEILAPKYPSILGLSLESAELTKIAYNTFVSHKIAFANAVMEISHKLGADCDEVIEALSLATRRVISPAYMRGGMGDGGSCHPRDNIAMSWLARRLELSADIFEDAMVAREDQTRWIADFAKTEAAKRKLPITILGYSYKPDIALPNGSPALLLHELLDRKAELIDPWFPPWSVPLDPAVFIIGCKHSQFRDWQFPRGSVVIDPHRYIPDQEGIEVIRLGEKKDVLPT